MSITFKASMHKKGSHKLFQFFSLLGSGLVSDDVNGVAPIEDNDNIIDANNTNVANFAEEQQLKWGSATSWEAKFEAGGMMR